MARCLLQRARAARYRHLENGLRVCASEGSHALVAVPQVGGTPAAPQKGRIARGSAGCRSGQLVASRIEPDSYTTRDGMLVFMIKDTSRAAVTYFIASMACTRNFSPPMLIPPAVRCSST